MTDISSPGGGSEVDGKPAHSMQIGEVATKTQLSLRSLRHWEEVGLLTPSGRSVGGFRLYTEDDVDRILAIRRMKPLGFSLEEMKAAMVDIERLSKGDGEQAAAVARLEQVREAASERRATLARQLEMADEFIDLLGRRLGRAGDEHVPAQRISVADDAGSL